MCAAVLAASALLLLLLGPASAGAAGATTRRADDESTVEIFGPPTKLIGTKGPPGVVNVASAARDGTSGTRVVRRIKPDKNPSGQVPATGDEEVVPAGTTTASGAGRKLQLSAGAACSFNIKNTCLSRKAFSVNFGYYTPNGIRTRGRSGWEARGWYRVGYGSTIKITAPTPVYLRYSNNLRSPSNTIGSDASFCVTSSAFWVLEGDDNYFYFLNDPKNTYFRTTSCSAGGGWWQGGYWKPKYCGTSFVSTRC